MTRRGTSAVSNAVIAWWFNIETITVTESVMVVLCVTGVSAVQLNLMIGSLRDHSTHESTVYCCWTLLCDACSLSKTHELKQDIIYALPLPWRVSTYKDIRTQVLQVYRSKNNLYKRFCRILKYLWSHL